MKASTARMIGDIMVGQARVFVGEDQGEHSCEQLADMMLLRLVQVNGEAPREIMDQVIAFKDRAREVFIKYLKEAQAIEHRKMQKAYGKSFNGNHPGYL